MIKWIISLLKLVKIFLRIKKKEEEIHILSNAIQTPDGTILKSYHTHDYKEHVDGITGETYMVDGGNSYFRYNRNKVRAKSLSVTTEDPHELIREHFTWGSFGKNGDEELHWVVLKDMETDHINAILRTQKRLAKHLVKVFEEELEWRDNND